MPPIGKVVKSMSSSPAGVADECATKAVEEQVRWKSSPRS
jgi:hypothetical protein